MFRHKRGANDFGAEIEAHIELEIERLQEQGLSYEQARTAAHQAFGNVTLAQERFYESGRWLWWDDFWHDIRYALRMLRKQPAFTLVAVLTLALGVGANTAIFSIVNAVLLRSLPFAHPDRLVKIVANNRGVGARDIGLSVPELDDLRLRAGVFEQVSAMATGDTNLTGAQRPQRLELAVVSPNYFSMLGASAHIGRVFGPSDEVPGFAEAAVISDSLWASGFGRSRNSGAKVAAR
jgi:hypothetical protein